MEPKEAAAALDKYQVTGWRQKITPFHGFTVVEDCYNAGPESMKAALVTLAGMPCAGRRIAVLADMLELGYLSQQAHRMVGELAGSLHLDAVYAYGEMARLIVEEAKKSRCAGHGLVLGKTGADQPCAFNIQKGISFG